MKQMIRSILCLILFATIANQAKAQIDPTLSIQGILKKSNGVAVEDGAYNITFKLYTVQSGGTALWTEVQPGVEVSSGIYSATLGLITPLNIPFNQLYYLGVTVGSTELTPRILLTSAPYALSLIGQTNKFPSSGLVQADSVKVNGGVLARGGTPGANGANRNGYAFSGNSGDKDSGVFSTAEGEVALYSNNVEVLEVTPGTATVNGNLAANKVSLNNNGNVAYNGVNDWRLVDVDDYEVDNEGWKLYSPPAGAGNSNAWQNTSGTGATVTDFGDFAGKALTTDQNYKVFKKQFAPPGTYTQIKVKFRYFILDSWGFGSGDQAWAAFSPNTNGTPLRVGWALVPSLVQAGGNMGTNEFRDASHFAGNSGWGDLWVDAEMTARYPSSLGAFWVVVGAGIDQGSADENFALGAIEIWVK